MIIFLHLNQKLTFSRMSTPQCHEINVMTFDAECHEICFVGWKTNVKTLMSWDLENVMRFIFSGTGSCIIHHTRRVIVWEFCGMHFTANGSWYPSWHQWCIETHLLAQSWNSRDCHLKKSLVNCKCMLWNYIDDLVEGILTPRVLRSSLATY